MWAKRPRQLLLYVAMLAAGVVIAFPFFWMLSTSLKSEAEATTFPPSVLPAHWLFGNYLDAWRAAPFGRYFLNSAVMAAGQVDAVFGYHFGQALTLDMKGFPTNVMPLKDNGVSFYGTVIYTSEQLLKSNPDLVKRFVRATLKSLAWTASHKKEAVVEVVRVSPDRELDLETKKLEIIYGLYNTPEYQKGFGIMNDAKWQSSIDILAAESGDLAKKPAANEMYTNAIIESLDEATLAEMMKKVTN